MAKRKKLTRKQLLKEPDKVITATGRMLQMAQAYQKQLTMGFIAILIVFGLMAGIRYFSERSETAAFMAFDAATRKYAQTAQVKSASEALAEVRPEFENILQAHGGRKATNLARLFFANICLNGGDIDSSVRLYEEAVESFSDMSALKGLALKGLACAYEEKNEPATAMAVYKRLLAQEGVLGKDEALYHLARLQEKGGDRKESTASFSKLISEYPESMYLELAKNKI